LKDNLESVRQLKGTPAFRTSAVLAFEQSCGAIWQCRIAAAAGCPVWPISVVKGFLLADREVSGNCRIGKVNQCCLPLGAVARAIELPRVPPVEELFHDLSSANVAVPADERPPEFPPHKVVESGISAFAIGVLEVIAPSPD
jgi:hypothetical protein